MSPLLDVTDVRELPPLKEELRCGANRPPLQGYAQSHDQSPHQSRAQDCPQGRTAICKRLMYSTSASTRTRT
jgi:hypothetical protein